VTKRPEYIIVGRFGRPRGVSGSINITPATDDPERFLELTEIFAVSNGNRERLQLEQVLMVGGRPVVKIKGIDNREEAARLTNMSIEIPIGEARSLPEGSYYQFELVGCRVIDLEGTEYGVIEEVMLYPANDLYRIKSERFGEILFPAVDRFVVEVNIKEKRVVIDPPEGLLES
jgi:16S rRNA processing protein RimM